MSRENMMVNRKTDEYSGKLKQLEARIDYHFQKKELLVQALTHTSYANEHRREGIGSYERLEFVGDAFLDAVAAEYLYRKHAGMGEGELSKLRASMVSEKPLASCAKMLGFPECLRLGKGEELTGGRERESIIADLVEAVAAAIYFDGGYEAAKTFILKHVLSDLHEADLFRDSKTPLQEILQDRNLTAEYRVVDESGPDHAKLYTVEVLTEGRTIGRGTGSTKKAAAQMAADEAIRRYEQTGRL